MEFLEQYSNYIVLVITLIMWAGVFFYMYSIDKKLNKIEKEK